MGGRDIDFELESFNRAFQVRSDDPRFAHALVDARMIAWLQDLPSDTGFEILDGTLLCRTPRRLDRDLTWRWKRWTPSWIARRRSSSRSSGPLADVLAVA